MIYKSSHGLTWLTKKILTYSIIYKFVMLAKYGIQYITDLSYISETLYSKEFHEVLKQYLFVNVKKDWIGRLYGVLNPNIDIEGNVNFSNTIIEIDGDNTNSSEFVKNWVYKQMHLIDQLFKINKLYDYININFKHVGPTNADNYLIVFDIISRKLFAKTLKSFLIQSILYICIAIVAMLIL
jgi:hypothetical protein